MVTSWMDNKSIMCINSGLEYDRRDTDNYLEICQSCQINMVSKVMRRLKIRFKYNVVVFYDIALDTDVLIGIFLVGITIITTLVVTLTYK
jgi:hypothetical protein